MINDGFYWIFTGRRTSFLILSVTGFTSSRRIVHDNPMWANIVTPEMMLSLAVRVRPRSDASSGKIATMTDATIMVRPVVDKIRSTAMMNLRSNNFGSLRAMIVTSRNTSIKATIDCVIARPIIP